MTHPAATVVQPALMRDKEGRVQASKHIEFVSEMPRTAGVKIDKKVLRAPFWAGQTRLSAQRPVGLTGVAGVTGVTGITGVTGASHGPRRIGKSTPRSSPLRRPSMRAASRPSGSRR